MTVDEAIEELGDLVSRAGGEGYMALDVIKDAMQRAEVTDCCDPPSREESHGGSAVMTGYTTVIFAAEIKLSAEEVAEADGNVTQAVQNEIGHTGAAVIKVIDPIAALALISIP